MTKQIQEYESCIVITESGMNNLGFTVAPSCVNRDITQHTHHMRSLQNIFRSAFTPYLFFTGKPSKQCVIQTTIVLIKKESKQMRYLKLNYSHFCNYWD